MTDAIAAPGDRPRLRFSDPRVFVPFTLVALIWGSTWLVIKDQISAVPPSWSITYRFVIASAGMLVLLALRRERLAITSAGWPVVLIVAVTQIVMNFHFVYRAELTITSGIAALFFALIMIPNSILAWFVLEERVSAGFVVGSAIAVAGVSLLMMHEFGTAGFEGALAGVIYALLATIAASVANVTQATPRAQGQPFLPLLTFAMIVGAAINAAIALALDGLPVWDARPGYGAGLVYLGIVGSVGTFPLYFSLIRNIGAGRAAYIGVATPILAMLLSTVFEGYRWTPLTVGGSLLAMVGLVIALRSRS